MQYHRYTDPKAFYQDVFPILLRHEAQNSLPLGNVVLGNEGGSPVGWRNPINWFMATVTDATGSILLTALMTPPHHITMYETDNTPCDAALDFLVEQLMRDEVSVPGVTAENKLAERFAKAYTAKLGLHPQTKKNLRIYTLTQVNEQVKQVGKLRAAQRTDLFYLPYWYLQFHKTYELVEATVTDTIPHLVELIDQQALFVLEHDGMPVSMAAAAQELVNGWCISLVYTPPYLRANGYASSCVAQLSQTVLDRGCQYTSLFTDLANPISNSIYQKIGYQPICDYNEVGFVE